MGAGGGPEGAEPVIARRRSRTQDQHPLSPEDDPYLAYLIWREQRDAAQPAPETDPGEPVAAPTRGSWMRRLAVWRRDDRDRPDR